MERDHGIDRVKALAIVCVVAIHCQTPFSIGRTDLLALAVPALTEWAVPGFFFLGGYLRARTTPYPPGTTARWLYRLLPAYLIASLMALWVRGSVFGESMSLSELPIALLTGSAWGVYYFVPLFLGALICSHALARWPRSAPWVCAISIVFLVLTRWNADVDPLWRVGGFHGIVRSPLFWWGYFFAGWVVRLWRETGRRPGWLFAVCSIVATLCIAANLAGAPPFERAVARVGASIAVPMSLLLWSTRRIGDTTLLLSEHSYDVYLFHFFAIAIARQWGFPDSGVAMPVTLWSLAFTSGLGAAVISKRALQRLSA